MERPASATSLTQPKRPSRTSPLLGAGSSVIGSATAGSGAGATGTNTSRSLPSTPLGVSASASGLLGARPGSALSNPGGTDGRSGCKRLDGELEALVKDRPLVSNVTSGGGGLKPSSSNVSRQIATPPTATTASNVAPLSGASAAAAASPAPEKSARQEDKQVSTLSTGIMVAGENEDNVDDELSIELSNQELMFQNMLRKRAEREAKKKLDKEEKKRIAEAQKAAALEAAFDGDAEALMKMFDEGIELETCDQHGTTLLSEASGGGAVDLVNLLLGAGADPNSLGRYRRTPLWRAAYAGSADAVKALLRGGGDPRECDEIAQKPVDITPNKDAKNYLLSWDTSSTDEIKKQMGAFSRPKGRNADKEAKQKTQAQQKELTDAVEEAERRLQIAKVEMKKKKKLAQNLRAQKVSLVEQGAEDKLPEAEKLLEKAEMEWKEGETIAKDLEWKLKRVMLKRRDWESAEQRKAQKKAGKLHGYKIELVLENAQQLDELKDKLAPDLELKKEVTTQDDVILRPGDVLLKEPPFNALRDKQDFSKLEISDEDWPVSAWFNHGFDVTIQLRALSDVLFKDVGDKRKSDGRWPLVIDPSGKTQVFMGYTGATVFTAIEMMESVKDPEMAAKVRRAFLRCIQMGGAFIINLQDFDFGLETVEEPFNAMDTGLWNRLTDRACLYSYLLTRRFARLVQNAPAKEAKELQQDFPTSSFLDNHLQEFVFGFITTFKEPNLEFAKSFYTIRVKDPNGEDDEAG
eukprot:TRINITY_DN73904_c0_g1_i1.p1 TRINITY_DN73904_c0_g1~~TRINITY_DN73904_c0_g1_i1.p1  ORF type:complete len:758 (-),score=186.80 TRINITY_DN73904_c0_g1_i1:49-2295(-)